MITASYDNATINFNGKAGELIKAADGTWKLKNDDGTRVEHLTDTALGNGDNDGEYWKVTTTDGTQYFFGRNKLPGWASADPTTNSTWTVPVFGDDSGEPCHASAFADSWCQQAWQWNLDYVVDPHGDAITYSYTKESNSYGRALKAADDTPYTRGGTLDRIDYGLRSDSVYSQPALARVNFTSSERCIAESGVTCAADTIDAQAAYWYDTPWDLNCKAGTDCDEGRYSPSFWSRKRLTGITAQVRKSDGTYANVDSWALTQHWGMGDIDYQLLLDSIQHTGHTGDTTTPSITLPKVTLSYEQLANRLDKEGDGVAPFIKERLHDVVDESGSQISVNYSSAACNWNALPSPASNTTRCFPQYYTMPGEPDPQLQWFDKYVTDSVTESDLTGGSPDQVTRYSYLDGGAWHFDDDDGLTKEKFKTWSTWRGYGHVRVETGGQDPDVGPATGMESQSDHYFLRGMDGDRTDSSGDTRTVTVDTGEGQSITDDDAVAGFEYKTVDYSAPDGVVLDKTVNIPWHHQTASRVRSWGTTTANLTGVATTHTWTSLDNGAGQKWRQTASEFSYENADGRVTQVDAKGDTATSADDRCTRVTYKDNTSAWILSLSRYETVAVSCATTPDRSKDVLADEHISYDGQDFGVAPTKGDATTTSTLVSHDGTRGTYQESEATFDQYGRQLTATDISGTTVYDTSGNRVSHTPSTDGRVTTTAYTPATGFATSMKVTTPPAAPGTASSAQTTTTSLDALRGLATYTLDTNNKRIDYTYDALGRTTKVWLPNRKKANGQTPNYEFTYTIDGTHAVAVGSKTLKADGSQQTSYVLYDGFLRARQTQDPGPDGGKLLSDTFYDERGLTSKTYATYYAAGAPSTTLYSVDQPQAVESQTWNTYDGLGRLTQSKQVAGNGDGGAVLSTTTTAYLGDRSTVTPPQGAVARTTITDAAGRTTDLLEYHGSTPTGTPDRIHYDYTPAGQLAKVTDQAGNEWSYQYDQRGRQTSATDPDTGTTTTRYDDRNQVTSTTNSRGQTLAYAYDGLGRKIEVRHDSATGPLAAKWVYDTITGAKGELASTTSYDADGNAYTSTVNTYDTLYRVLKATTTIPATEENGALAGSYSTNTAYNTDDTVASVSYPAAGNLPTEVITPTYDDLQRPIKLSAGSTATYVTDTKYSNTGKPLQYTLANGGKSTVISQNYEWGTQRLHNVRVEREDVAGVDKNATYTYDQAGNILGIADVSRGGTDNQCFTYDGLNRLTEAWSQSTTTCADAPSSDIVGGVTPYWQSFTYDAMGNRTQQVQHDTSGNLANDTTSNYTYAGAANAQPHTLTQVTTDGPTASTLTTYQYDKAGNTTQRLVGGNTQNLDWDPDGHLTSVTQGSQTTSYVYDADGNRLIRDTGTERTLYLGNQELTLTKGAAKPTCTRYYDLGGGNQAVRTDDNNVTFLPADHQGTAQLAIDADTLSMQQRRTTPFGENRGTQPTSWPGDQGFLGGTTDDTGLTHLGAREYDPTTGRFISVDPVLELTDPQQLNGYAYAANNPVTNADPTGLCANLSCILGLISFALDVISWASALASAVVSTNTNNKPASTGGGGSGSGSGSTAGGGGGNSGGGGCPWYNPRCALHKLGNWYDDHKAQVWGTVAEVGTGFACGATAVGTGIVTGGVGGVAVGAGCGAIAGAAGAAVENALTPDADHSATGTLKAEAGGAAAGAVAGATGGALGEVADLAKPVLKKAVAKATEKALGNTAAEEAPEILGKAGRVKTAGSSPGCKHSFLPGTAVAMADGTHKAIDAIQPGDSVLATDPETGKTSSKTVTASITTKTDEHYVDLKINTDAKHPGSTKTLTATTHHPFWVAALNEWVEAKDLKAGQWLRTSAGTYVQITAVRQYDRNHQTTHDLTVADTHTYYVLAGETPVLVHNCGDVYRSDTRDPSEIFDGGFAPKGDNMNLEEHVAGVSGVYTPDSGFVSTTTSKSHALSRKGHTYVIDSRGASGGIDVNKRIPGNVHANEAEIAVPRTIDSCHIRGCWHETTGEWIPNPNYRE